MIAFAQSLVQYMSARFRRVRTKLLQPSSTTPEPTGKLCFRNSMQRMR